ncbi:HNH endonuclease family protein [Loktanella sp. DJP18]|uniref:HNH endonuclease family protein n=1 Tax=Loktanella sp. DJP18 TaxID=3409788 RepID=UPI003BB72CEB
MFRTQLALIVSVITLTITLATQEASAAPAQQPPVKMSSSGICHCPGGDYYDKTSSFRPFHAIEQCLANGGRQPARGQGNCTAQHGQTSPKQTASVTAPRPQSTFQAAKAPYDRDLFGGWTDIDSDCMNTRQEILADLSTGPVRKSKNGCTVVAGRWLDPYTDRIYTTAIDLDIDHMVPLAFAWHRGADKWPSNKRVQFANDPVNLFAVQAAANRQKGASGPLDWMPPSAGFHCQYILRFVRISKTYGLAFDPREAAAIDAKTKAVCR